VAGADFYQLYRIRAEDELMARVDDLRADVNRLIENDVRRCRQDTRDFWELRRTKKELEVLKSGSPRLTLAERHGRPVGH
jgi:hypothetical protein